MKLNDSGEIEKILNNSKLESLSTEDLVQRAFKFHSKGNILEASKYYQYILSRGVKDYRILSNYAVICKQNGDISKSIKLFKLSINQFPGNIAALFNLAKTYTDIGDLVEAEKTLSRYIQKKQNSFDGFLELARIQSLKLDLISAEKAIRKAISIKTNSELAHFNLGVILHHMGKLDEAKLSFLNAVELNVTFAKPYYSLSILQHISTLSQWENNLFSEKILLNQSDLDLASLYFARANVMHNKNRYDLSANNLIIANRIKSKTVKYNINKRIQQSTILFDKSIHYEPNYDKSDTQCVFIVGMPRSGSTLIESILSLNTLVTDLGETDNLEISYNDWLNQADLGSSTKLSDLYLDKINLLLGDMRIVTDKQLNNFQFSGIIASQIPYSKIIHCQRDPLDIILSMYRTNFVNGHSYSSSLVDCSKLYLHQESLMRRYKANYPDHIYSVNYNELVLQPEKEIKKLIKWLGWQWEDIYLSPHLNTRSVFTASSTQVRNPINSRSIGLWKKYTTLLKPAIDMLNI